MGCLGVLFALNEEQTGALRAVERVELPDYISEELEEDFFENRKDDLYELDKSWDAMHRALTGGALLFGNACAPLSGVILGGEVLYGDEEDEDDYIVIWKSPIQVQEIAAAMAEVTERQFREKYFALDENDYGAPLDEEDFGYTWAYFRDSLPFWQRAAAQHKSVLFTVDQ